jgi:membrane protein DedA with SNARE-associated domain
MERMKKQQLLAFILFASSLGLLLVGGVLYWQEQRLLAFIFALAALGDLLGAGIFWWKYTHSADSDLGDDR